MTFLRIYTHYQTTITSKNTHPFANMKYKNEKSQLREKRINFRILNFKFNIAQTLSMTGFRAVFYPNFNVTTCDKKCNFFMFSAI